MTAFTTHTLETAPQASRPYLHNAQSQLGFVPNLNAVLAESPATLEANHVLTALFDKTAFSVTERQLILLSISRVLNCSYCLAAHGTVAKMQKVPSQIVHAVYYNRPLKDEKLEALRAFVRAVLEAEGWVQQHTLQAFYRAGYEKQHVLEVVLGISFKTLSNYVNHINDTPIDAEYMFGIPENELV